MSTYRLPRGYVYDHSGGSCGSREQSQACLSYAEMERRRRSQRRLKLTGDSKLLDVCQRLRTPQNKLNEVSNADLMATYTVLNEPTLYPSPYMVLTEQGYTKHYYAGTERVAARIGSGGLSYDATCVTDNGEVAKRSDKLFWEGLKALNEHKAKPEDFAGMSLVDAKGKEVDWLNKIDLDKLAMSWQLEAKIDPGKIHAVIDDNSYPAMPGNTRYENEPDVFFYHSDHLGGASWITDVNGKPVQHLQYLPFGEPYVNQHPAGYQERFTFTGKERDGETGYGYFGARYMDYSLMTSFISVDRYASKYPFISPYAYCAWNPIKLIDPTGDTICYKYNNKTYQYVKTSTGRYSWMDSKGNIYKGGEDVKFDQLTDALRTLQSKSAGKELIEKLTEDDRTVQIGVRRGINKSDAKNGTWVFWNPDMTEEATSINEDGSRTRPSFIGLAHELAHINEVWHGKNDQSEWFKDPINGNTVPRCEIPVCDVENEIRAEHNIPRRAYYFYFEDEKRSYKYGPLLNK